MSRAQNVRYLAIAVQDICHYVATTFSRVVQHQGTVFATHQKTGFRCITSTHVNSSTVQCVVGHNPGIIQRHRSTKTINAATMFRRNVSLYGCLIEVQIRVTRMNATPVPRSRILLHQSISQVDHLALYTFLVNHETTATTLVIRLIFRF